MANIEDVRLLEWAPGVGQFQAADLTGLWSCFLLKAVGAQVAEGRDPGLVFLDRVLRLGAFVEGTSPVLVHPNPDQGA